MIHAPQKYHHHHHSSHEHSPPLPPTTTNILGTWYITRSSSPFWSDKRNPTITLTADTTTTTTPPGSLPLSALSQPTTTSPTPILTNKTSYQTLSSSSVKTTTGTDRAISGGKEHGPIQMEWRGSGWLRMVSAQWEILGWGGADDDDEWLLVFANKSMFMPAGISLYSRTKTGVDEMVWAGIEVELGGLVERYPAEGELRELVMGMEVVRFD
ncbi:uncharacterized protein AKAW2_11920A [Aspergillus luchuensis]|uniref:Uncharacterized protein n=1 Tax=Aspergillus kawachii TaxID=1069201 RepID=A0A146F1H9_ASPKA|nr:uncharacterized protein AKAW2_11920A [Aspergillus luchuensis]BCR94874.1 hypothetical protein AKAW2_11920A [Aspergillus luchuensis]BCS07451.1 hypothetical protein ALUC_11832A [Aspergillus luchuensis]GAA86107.1 hypothetical protein AKAW_04221 [Aspergillus luchuensis IFO 4308]GAT19621.1 hypothetical protein RIB2604_00602010 [Aspergillus luchuensis]